MKCSRCFRAPFRWRPKNPASERSNALCEGPNPFEKAPRKQLHMRPITSSTGSTKAILSATLPRPLRIPYKQPTPHLANAITLISTLSRQDQCGSGDKALPPRKTCLRKRRKTRSSTFSRSLGKLRSGRAATDFFKLSLKQPHVGSHGVVSLPRNSKLAKRGRRTFGHRLSSVGAKLNSAMSNRKNSWHS